MDDKLSAIKYFGKQMLKPISGEYEYYSKYYYYDLAIEALQESIDRNKGGVFMTKLDELIQIANEKYDGHFTLMKFTTNWRCCFGTIPYTFDSIKYMAKGKTMEEAIDNCIKNNVNSVDIYKTLKKVEILTIELHDSIKRKSEI